jgi:predicted nucleic acid-binding protein
LIYVDSNYWIYWLDSRLPEHRHVTAAMRRAVSSGILMNYVTLVEIAHYLRLLPEDEFSSRLSTIQNLSTLTLADLDHETTQLALEALPRYSGRGIGGRDSVIIATMKTHGVRDILTHDRAFENVEGIRAIDTLPPRL